MTSSVVYECVKVDQVTQTCELWQVEQPQPPLALSKADADLITLKILGFMAFVFVLKQIKKSIM